MSGSTLEQAELTARLAEVDLDLFEIITADDWTLLLDLDNVPSRWQYDRVILAVLEHIGPATIESWPSKSGNKHVRIQFDPETTEPMPYATRYALQAALGSDGLREALALVQMRNGCDEASILFKPKFKVEYASDSRKRSKRTRSSTNVRPSRR